MNSPGLMLVISAPSGAGKSTLIRYLTKSFDNFSFSISCTTRAPRPGEKDGREYHFLERQEFLRRRDVGYFAEWAEVYGNFYGTPRQATEELLAAGRDVIFDIDVQGAQQLRESMQQGCYVFILPPSRQVLEARLTGRGTDSPESVARRLAAARTEIEAARQFDHWIINDDLARAQDELRAVYVAEKTRPGYRRKRYELLCSQWEA
jgi:guanylate kinase